MKRLSITTQPQPGKFKFKYCTILQTLFVRIGRKRITMIMGKASDYEQLKPLPRERVPRIQSTVYPTQPMQFNQAANHIHQTLNQIRKYENV